MWWRRLPYLDGLLPCRKHVERSVRAVVQFLAEVVRENQARLYAPQ